MDVIRTISKYLIKQDAGDTKRAAPCFNLYYKPDDPLSQLQRETNAAVEASPELQGIKGTIDGLVDIDTPPAQLERIMRVDVELTRPACYANFVVLVFFLAFV